MRAAGCRRRNNPPNPTFKPKSSLPPTYIPSASITHRTDVNVSSNPAFAVGATDTSELEYRRAQTDLALYIENAHEETSVDA